MKIAPNFKSVIFDKFFREFLETTGKKLIQKTLLLPAKGGKYSESKIKKRLYSDMPYWVHIFNGLFGALILIQEDEDLLNELEINIDELKLFITAFAFHDANKLINKKYEDFTDEDFAGFYSDYNVEEFWNNYEDYLNDLKYLILSTESGTTVFSYSVEHTKVSIRLLDNFKKYLKFGDQISNNENRINSTKDFYVFLTSLIERLNLKAPELHYIQIDKNIYRGITQSVYQAILYDLYDQVVYQMRDGFIYIGKKYDLDVESITSRAISILEVRNDDYQTIAQNEIAGQYDRANGVRLEFLHRKLDFEQFNHIIDAFIKTSTGKLFKLFKNNSDEHLNQLVTYASFLPAKIISEKLYCFHVDPDMYISLSEDQKVKWRLTTLFRLVDIGRKEFTPKLPNLYELIDTWSKGKYGHNIITEYKKIEDDKFKGKEKNDFQLAWQLDFIQDIVNSGKYSEIYNEIVVCLTQDKAEVQSESKQWKDIMSGFIQSFVFKDLNQILLNSYVSKVKKICCVCGRFSETKLEDAAKNTFVIKPRNPTNKTLSSLKNDKNYICSWCELDNRILSKKFKKSDYNAIVYFDFFDYFFNINKSFFFKLLQVDTKQSEETDYPLRINDNYNIEDYFPWIYCNFGNTLVEQFKCTKWLLSLVKKFGLKIYVSSVYTPYNQHDEMFKVDPIKSPLKSLGLSTVRIHNIEDKIELIKYLKELKVGDKSFPELFTLTKDPNSVFWLVRRVKDTKGKEEFRKRGLDKFKYSLFINISDMSNTIQMAEFLSKIHRLNYDASSHEETEIIRKSLDILKDGVKRNVSEEDIISSIAGNLYKKYKNNIYRKNNNNDTDKKIVNYAELFALHFVTKLFREDWKNKLPTPKQTKYWIAQFAYSYMEASNKEWELYNQNNN